MKRGFWKAVLISLIIAGVISIFASGFPDGLEKVAGTLGFEGAAKEKPVLAAPIPNYTMPGVRNSAFATGLAGVTGTVIVLVIGLALGKVLLVKKRK